ncbi:MAG: cupin [Dehalococcoidia bacterium]|nr:cupin [Chloroflexota bacterium]MAX04844.1 cupin [Dehalococcoidia bacterium]MBE42568.1 cupin [Chloroflexota bacterium]HIC49452.1 cupin domain-containing protein [Dehalococcoidia bacterium]|tara:strand:+ start:644 stop:1015 length:372 start_codon:yes stop_codon:yes gene_type:complete
MYWKQTEETDINKVERIHDGEGLIKRRNLFGSSSHLPVDIEIWELDEGVSEGDHTHGDNRPLEEFYYFLEGTGEMTIGEEIIPVNINDAVMVPPGVDHGIRNTGQGPLKMMIVWGISEGIYDG